uniref:Uncharacterized protein n=1 Tax=Anguilla anguilla TaxID=7936 RepID=A0A0E9XN54_ANGAN
MSILVTQKIFLHIVIQPKLSYINLIRCPCSLEN